jgi:hypothetical protein
MGRRYANEQDGSQVKACNAALNLEKKKASKRIAKDVE